MALKQVFASSTTPNASPTRRGFCALRALKIWNPPDKQNQTRNEGEEERMGKPLGMINRLSGLPSWNVAHNLGFHGNEFRFLLAITNNGNQKTLPADEAGRCSPKILLRLQEWKNVLPRSYSIGSISPGQSCHCKVEYATAWNLAGWPRNAFKITWSCDCLEQFVQIRKS